MVKIALVLASMLAVAGCNAILGIDYGQPRPADSGTPDASMPDASMPDASDDGASDVTTDPIEEAPAVDADPRCPVRWPAPPDHDDDPGGGAGTEFELAAESLQLDVTPDFGLDLDGKCTCPDAPSCSPRMGRLDLQCDEPGGRDVMANKFLQSWVALGETALSQAALGNDLADGRAGALFRIHNYNGLANDKFIIVEFFGQTWIPPVGGVDQATRRDGSDRWSLYTGSIVGARTSVQEDIAAYVTDHVFVARLNTATIALRPNTGVYDNPLVIVLNDAILTGTLVPTERGFRVESGQLSGRWAATDAFTAIAQLADANGFLCGTHPFFVALKTQICENLDIASVRASDNTGATCDAMSLALGFTAGPAQIGNEIPNPPTVENNCPTSPKPSCNP